jgi:peptidoglycan/xylan/chitin deacetylase (PgdA/CDA1 family)
MYHRIAISEFDPWNLAVSPNEFELQLARLRTKTVLPLTEFVRLHARQQLPRNVAAITFDDGYACNALVAAPMLESFGLPATFFIVSDAISRREEYWWDQLAAIVNGPGFDCKAAIRLFADYSVRALARTAHPGTTPNADYVALWWLLRSLSAEERRRYLDELRDLMRLEKVLRQSHRPMTLAELRTLAANPLFEIGGHTMTHPALSTMPLDEQKEEIVSGSRRLEASVGVAVRCFSYPFGDLGPVTREIVMAAGFECAVTTEPRRVRVGDDPFRLPRRQALNRNAPPPPSPI